MIPSSPTASSSPVAPSTPRWRAPRSSTAMPRGRSAGRPRRRRLPRLWRRLAHLTTESTSTRPILLVLRHVALGPLLRRAGVPRAVPRPVRNDDVSIEICASSCRSIAERNVGPSSTVVDDLIAQPSFNPGMDGRASRGRSGLGRGLRGSGVPLRPREPMHSPYVAGCLAYGHGWGDDESDVNPADPFSYYVTSRSYSCCNKQECRALCKDLCRGDSSGAREMVARPRRLQGDGDQQRRRRRHVRRLGGRGCEDWWSSSSASMSSSAPSPTAPAVRRVRRRRPTSRCRRRPMIPPPPSPPPPSEGTGEVCCCVTSRPVNGLPMSSSKLVAKARRWLLANHPSLSAARPVPNDRVVSGAWRRHLSHGILPGRRKSEPLGVRSRLRRRHVYRRRASAPAGISRASQT